MRNLREHLIEITGTIWLLIVGIEYLVRYFVNPAFPDLWQVYVGMLLLTAAVLAYEAHKSARARKNADRG